MRGNTFNETWNRSRPVVATPIGLPYGALQKNGTFNGVIGYLERKVSLIRTIPQ